MQLLLSFPVLLEFLHLAFRQLTTVRQDGRYSIGIPCPILVISLEHILRSQLSLFPFLLFNFFSCFPSYSRCEVSNKFIKGERKEYLQQSIP